VEHIQHLFSNIHRYPVDAALGKCLQSSDQVNEKTSRVVIPFIQRQPRSRSLATHHPLADQRGFAKAGGCRDEAQFVAREETLVQPLDQVGA
jgi:hypothetical protein